MMDTKNIIYIFLFVLSSVGISKDIVSILCVDLFFKTMFFILWILKHFMKETLMNTKTLF